MAIAQAQWGQEEELMKAGDFEDSSSAPGLKTIHIHYGKQGIEGVNCQYVDGKFAGERGDHSSNYDGHIYDPFRLRDEDDIVSVYIWKMKLAYLSMVSAIQFITWKGKVSQIFGFPTGDLKVYTKTDDNQVSPMAGFKGSLQKDGTGNGVRISALEPVWSQTRKIGMPKTVIGEIVGGNGGRLFNNLSDIGDITKKYLKSITVWTGRQANSEVVVGIQCTYSDNTQTGVGGRDRDNNRTFELFPGEHIKYIEGRSGAMIDGIKFHTDKDRESEFFGNSRGGTPFTFDRPSDNLVLVGFTGRGAEALDAISPIWQQDPPVSTRLSIDHWGDPVNEGSTGSINGTRSSSVRENRTKDSMKCSFEYSVEVTQETTVSIDEGTKTAIGAEVNMEVTASGKAGVPFVAEGEVSATAGFSASATAEWSKNVTSGQTKRRTVTVKLIDSDVVVPPNKRVIGEAVAYESEIKNAKWSGTLTIKYMSGATKIIPATGTFTSLTASKLKTSYDEEEL